MDRREQLLIDSYNIIHAWGELRSILTESGLTAAREALIERIVDYAGSKSLHIILVFDAHRYSMVKSPVEGTAERKKPHTGKKHRKQSNAERVRAEIKPYSFEIKVTEHSGAPLLARELERGPVTVVYTGEGVTADAYIERWVADNRHRYELIRVATNDSLQQVTVFTMGAARMTSSELLTDLKSAKRELHEGWLRSPEKRLSSISETLDAETIAGLRDMARPLTENNRRGK